MGYFCRRVHTAARRLGWMGRSYFIIDAKLWALRRCEHYSPLPVCTILWCRAGR